MGRRFQVSESAAAKAIAIVRKAGLPILAIEFPRDGAVRIVTAGVDSAQDAQQDDRKPEPWT